MNNYRLGLDVGTNSIGWCTLHIQLDGTPISLLDWGVRIFNDGREPAKKEVPGESSAVQRRTARGMRRRYDRLIMRNKNLIQQLAKLGLLPETTQERKALEHLNPLKLRDNAVQKKLKPYEIGRAFFHLQKRRGFKSNRKDAQKETTKEVEGMKGGINKLNAILADNQTLGQFLYHRHSNRESARFRPSPSEKNKIMYDFYPTRKMVEYEFNAIWKAQQYYYPDLLTEKSYSIIHKAIFYQRPLKPQPKGKCSIIAADERLSWALPSAQRFRIIKEINNLVLSAPYEKRGIKLDKIQKKKLFEALCSYNKKSPMTFQNIKKILKFPSVYQFNLETEQRTGLEGDKTSRLMREEIRFGSKWDNLSSTEQDDIILKLINDDSKSLDYMEDEAIIIWLINDYKLTTEQAEKTLHTTLPPSYTKFGKTVIDTILPKMVDEEMLEHEAIASAGWQHSSNYSGQIFDSLPYYGEILENHVVKNELSSDPMVKQYGKIGNPTVHIVLNQIRRLMNKLKEKHGCWPQEIVIEMVRDLKKGPKEIQSILKDIKKNNSKRDEWKKVIAQYKESEPTHNDYLKMKLWEELAKDPTHRKCVYTGKTISQSMLFSGNQVQIDHILPYPRTLDNTSANLIVVTTAGNQIKRSRSPYEAFSSETGEYAFEQVRSRCHTLSKSKQWRFLPEAMEIFESKAKTIMLKSSIDGSEQIIETGLDSFAARQLVDTSYIAKLAKKYLAYACENGEKAVIASPGTLTGLLRKAWGLNQLLDSEEKNRNDHRHHAVDALIIAMTTRSMVKKVAEAAKKEEETGTGLVKFIPKPWPNFEWESLKDRLNRIIVSHKPDHGSPAQINGGTSGRLHEDTYYGYVGKGVKKGTIQITVKKPLSSFTKNSDLDNIRDLALKEALLDFVVNRSNIELALLEFSNTDHINGIKNIWKGIRSIRVLVEKPENVLVSVKKDANKVPWKLALGGSNQRAEIYCPKDGKKAGIWQIEIIKTFNANNPNFVPTWRKECPNAQLVMKIHINDLIAYEEENKSVIKRVRKINTSGEIVLVDSRKAKLDNNEGWQASANSLYSKNARLIFVEIDGTVYDPLGIITTKDLMILEK